MPPYQPNAVELFTVILLRHGERYLLLQRAASKRFAPNRWTGIGGRVEPDELADLSAAALRELHEESGIEQTDVQGFALRRALLSLRPAGPLTLLLYFSGRLAQAVTPHCPEGTLSWRAEAEIAGLDVIENTAAVLPLLIADEKADPDARGPLRLGASRYQPDGSLAGIVWLG